MKKIALTLLVSFIVVIVAAQQSRVSLISQKVAQIKQPSSFILENWFGNIPSPPGMMAKGRCIAVNKTAILRVYDIKPKYIEMAVPLPNNSTCKLELFEQPINTTGDYSFGEIQVSARRVKKSTEQGLHYRGCVKGDSNSVAAVSIFNNGNVMVLFSTAKGNFNIGKIAGNADYVVYNDATSLMPGFACSFNDTVSDRMNLSVSNFAESQNMSMLCKRVRFYWEVNYGMFRYNFSGDLNAVQNYVSGLFNQFATLFVNEGIDVELAESYVWTSPDPYRNGSSSDGLSDFVEHWRAQGNNFNGDLAHLLAGGRENNGGKAFQNLYSICEKDFAYGYSNVYGYYNNYPVYSWDLNVIMHETGHNLGSNHTHWCGWNTGPGATCGAIDNCGATESSSSCSTCGTTYNTSTSGWMGTVMSYCHLISGIGTNLAYGYGSLPNATVRNTIMNSNCLVNTTVWNGSVDSSWEKFENWSCGNVPDSNTHVVLNNAAPVFPVIRSDARAASVTNNNGSSLKVNSGYSLLIQPALPKSNILPWPSSRELYITGNATPAGWMNTGDPEVLSQKFKQLPSGTYVLSNIYLTGNRSYLFVPVYGNWSDKFGYVGTANTNNISRAPFMQFGQDIASPSVSGYYNVYVDFKTGFFTVNYAYPKITTPPNNELYITGNATPAGWMNTGDLPIAAQKFVQKSSTLFEISSIFLTGGNSFLFVPFYGNWSNKYGGLAYSNNSNNPKGDAFVSNGSDLITPAVSGNYKITVDFQLGMYTITKL